MTNILKGYQKRDCKSDLFKITLNGLIKDKSTEEITNGDGESKKNDENMDEYLIIGDLLTIILC